MSVLYLHVGTPKTGTSFLQNFFRINNERIQKQGYVYPDFGRTFPGIGKARNGHFLIYKGEDAETVYTEFMDQIKALSGQYEHIILSEEGLWNHGKKIGRFVRDMKAAEIEVKVIVYLRRQDLFLQSKWAQNVKETMQKSFFEYFQVQKLELDYYQRLCELSELVGKEQVLVRVYEKQQFEGVNKDLLSDFFVLTGLQHDEEFVGEDGIRNPSLGGIYLETKRKLNYHPQFATKLNFVVPYLFALAERDSDVASYSTNKYFTYEQQMEVLAQFAESNGKIAREFLGREDGILFRDVIEKVEGEQEEYTEQEYFQILAEVILLQREKMEEQAEKQTQKDAKYTKEIEKLKASLEKAKADKESEVKYAKATLERERAERAKEVRYLTGQLEKVTAAKERAEERLMNKVLRKLREKRKK